MPKKFKEVNSKAAEARDRKAATKREAEERKKREEEDEYWRDDDKQVKRKQDRKDEREKKRQEQLERKLELKKLADEEEASLKSKTPAGGGATKITRAEIAAAKSREKTMSSGASKKLTEEPPLLENPNLLMKERAEQGHLDASTIDEALVVLSSQEPSSYEKHPEKRMKAAYATFEERELPRLKEENPNLRMSQLKQKLRKDWMKSPDNPMNQAYQTFNSKT